jgi:hypothetical protein
MIKFVEILIEKISLTIPGDEILYNNDVMMLNFPVQEAVMPH